MTVMLTDEKMVLGLAQNCLFSFL